MAYSSFPFPTFQPAMRNISAITNAFPCEVTTTINHQYIVGTIVRLYIPFADGMQQANQLTGTILSVPTTTTFTLDIDTRLFDVFSIPIGVSPHVNVSANVVPVGESNDILTAATQNVLPY